MTVVLKPKAKCNWIIYKIIHRRLFCMTGTEIFAKLFQHVVISQPCKSLTLDSMTFFYLSNTINHCEFPELLGMRTKAY